MNSSLKMISDPPRKTNKVTPLRTPSLKDWIQPNSPPWSGQRAEVMTHLSFCKTHNLLFCRNWKKTKTKSMSTRMMRILALISMKWAKRTLFAYRSNWLISLDSRLELLPNQVERNNERRQLQTHLRMNKIVQYSWETYNPRRKIKVVPKYLCRWFLFTKDGRWWKKTRGKKTQRLYLFTTTS